ncbi:FtsK/SpoIIIE domain-containing protein [Pseudokineococcus sp. 1T1Z-3]|uniref:FtsK/SpoIIIE domain-containing protein n=1 Tax=Pseudokineococcus sp. 1T1Z-3 TaxID=3132745 RepID=UPI0030B75B2F
MDAETLRLTLVDAARAGAVVDVEVEVDLRTRADGSAPVLDDVEEDLAAVLGRPPAAGPGGYGWACGGVPLTPATVLGAPPLVHGAVLVRRARRAVPGPRREVPSACALSLHVVAGPDAGAVVPLPPGSWVVGRGQAADVRLADPRLSRRHLRVDVDRDGARVADLAATNGTRVDGVSLARDSSSEPDGGPRGGRCGEGTPVRAGARLVAGASTVELRLGAAPRRPATWDGRGTRVVVRPPAPPPARAGARLVRPRRPEPPARPRTAWVASLVPLVVAVPMALLWSPWALLMGLASPLVAVVSTSTERRAWRKQVAADADAAARRTAALEEDVRRALQAEESLLRRLCPGAGDVVDALAGAGPHLWERRSGDPLLVALGTGDAPSSTRVEVEDPEGPGGRRTERPRLADVPLVVDLADGLGVRAARGATRAGGDGGSERGLVRWVLLQAAALHAPSGLRVVVLTDDAAAWAWVRWLPHAGWDAVAADAGARTAQVAALLAGAERPGEEPGGRARPGTGPAPRTVLVVDGGPEVGATTGLGRLLAAAAAEAGPGAPSRGGAGTVCAVVLAREQDLPDGCGVVAELGGEDGLDLLVRGGDGADPLRGTPTTVGPATAARTARAAAPLREAGSAGAAAGVPTRLALPQLLPAGRWPTPAELTATWAVAAASGSLVPVPVGADAEGSRLLDLGVDGPHALVAGTTGAGKSELLRTLVLSLALHHAPEDLSFVLVDYKGGAAFSAVAGLPHVSGLVTDLDSRLTERALRSLGAEVARRERLLRRVGAGDLADYRRRRRRHDPVLGRLVLVVDEFRVLAEELPDFVDGLVRLAAVGRSLGLHLVLATQRPAGVVGADVAANVNLRIALRVRDEHDSLDVVEARDAARLPASVPGRSLWRTGGGALEEVQVASAGATTTAGPRVVVRAGAGRAGEGRAGEGQQGARTTVPATSAPPPEEVLAPALAAVRAAWASLGSPAPASPWLPPLPTRVPLPAAVRAGSGASPDLRLRWGLVDEPAAARRSDLCWDLTRLSHLLVVGAPRSGRTGAARAVLAAAAAQTTPGQLVVHVVDTSGALAGAAALPGVASVVAGDDVEHAGRVLAHLLAVVAARRAAARAAGTAADDAHGGGAHGGGGARTTLLLVLDGWEAAQAAWEEAGSTCADQLADLLRDGPGAGVLVLLTGAPRLLGGRLGAAFGTRLVLRVTDPVDAVLAGLPAREAPVDVPAGRGVLLADHGPGGPEASTASAGTDDTRPATTRYPGDLTGDLTDAVPAGSPADHPGGGPVEVQVALVTRLADHRGDGDHGAPTVGPGAPPRALGGPAPALGDPALRLPALPGRVLADTLSPPADGLLLGVGGPGATTVALQPELDGPVCLVLGPPGSGRTSALATLGRSGAARGWRTVLVGGPPPAGAPGPKEVLRVDPGSPDAAGRLQRAVPDGGPPVLLLVDDADLLEGTALGSAVAEVVDALVRRTLTVPDDASADGAAGARGPRATGALVVVAATTAAAQARSSGLLGVGRRRRSGVLLAPSGPLDGEAVGLRGGRWPRGAVPGRGLLVRRGASSVLQVALPGPPG